MNQPSYDPARTIETGNFLPNQSGLSPYDTVEVDNVARYGPGGYVTTHEGAQYPQETV